MTALTELGERYSICSPPTLELRAAGDYLLIRATDLESTDGIEIDSHRLL